jgi:F-type H+-transporting ATPase subunit a
MQEFEIFKDHTCTPLAQFGLDGTLFTINHHTIFYTWIALAIIIGLTIFCRIALTRKNSIARFIVLMSVREFKNLAIQTLGRFDASFFIFAASLFTYILICNLLSLVPWLEEPTADLNTTLALGISSFIYVQYSAIRVNGIKAYINEYFQPFFLLFPLNVIGELSTIISISFRLFGNIAGGAIISNLWLSTIRGLLFFEVIGIGVNLLLTLFFGIFEGFVQAFVFSMLSLTYLSMALEDEGDEESL